MTKRLLIKGYFNENDEKVFDFIIREYDDNNNVIYEERIYTNIPERKLTPTRLKKLIKSIM